jgi:two-component system response regulator RegX3
MAAARQPERGGRPILVVEDEPSIAESIRYNLEREGFRVAVAADGRRALDRFRSEKPALVVLDLMLPEMSGLDVCRRIRDESTVPIVMLTAKDSEADKVAGLELGADDYVTKPFSMRELVSRVRAHLRRAGMTDFEGPDVLTGGPVVIDRDRHEVRVRGAAISLPPKEFAVLEILLSRKGRLITRETILGDVWGGEYFGDTRTLDVHIKRLRHKIEEDPHNPTHILTVRGLGYKFADAPE